MQKAYSRINWENYPSTETPLNESNLNRIDLALDTVDNRVVEFDLTKANQTDLLTCVDGITFNTSTGILTISFKNGTTATIDTGLAKLAVNFDYDDDPTSPHYQQLILEMKDGTYKYIDLSSMITQFEFDNTSTVVFNVDAQTGHISAVVPDGSITANKLDPNVVVTMQAIEDAAEADGAYTQTKVFDGTYGFGDAEITAYANDDFTAFRLTWEAFDEDQVLEGTVDDGIVTVDYDETGFMTGDAQLIWDDAVASENAWEPLP